MDIIAEIRRRHLVSGETISVIARSLNLSRPTVRKHLRSTTAQVYQRQQQPAPKLGQFQSTLEAWLNTERHLPRSQRRTARRLYEDLQVEGYRGAYDSVQRLVKQWKALKTRPGAAQAFIPLLFAPGEACQFDWSHEQAEIAGVMQTIKVAQFRLCHSRKMFVVAYPRETQEMVLDAHNRAFAFFGGVPQRVIYDNLKTAVDAILVGKDRIFNRRFLALANHYLFEPVACTPAAGWEKGQVENQVGNIREWLFTPLARFASFADLNHWLATRCQELAQRKHPTERSRSIAECFVQEQAHLRVIDAPFDGYVEQMRSVSSTCLVRVDRNQYSVPAQWAGKVTSVRCTADEIRIVADDQLIARHARRFGRDQLVYDPWHYLAVLDKKPGALRNGAPFVTWDLPEPIKQVREYLLKQSRGDRAFVDLLLLARDVGLEALQVACELALESGVINGSHVNELRLYLSSTSRRVDLARGPAIAH
nr:IS21 family transposase [Pseudomonas fluorescens]